MTWLPRIAWIGASMSDGNGPDAEGRMLSIEWLGLIIDFAVYRRGPEFGS